MEVLKGPRSALFGRGEPGGSINLTTKRPEFRTGGDFELLLVVGIKPAWRQTIKL